MIRFLHRWLVRKQPSIIAGDVESDQKFNTETQEILFASFELIKKMRADGIDLSKPRPVTHLLIGEDSVIAGAKNFFKEKGFDIVEAGDGRLLLGDDVPLSEDWALDIVPRICTKASELGLIYDGWDVDMSNDQIEQK